MTDKSDKQNLVLSIETAIAEGSLALLAGDHELAGKVGGVSRAEQILDGIEQLLQTAVLEISDIGLITVSLGPGSFTGIRIGISTALGLCKALDIECIGVSAFKAVAATVSDGGRSVVLPLGRNMYAVQNFSVVPPKEASAQEPEVVSETELLSLFQTSDQHFLLHPSVNKSSLHIAEFTDGNDNFVECDSKIARLVGTAAVAGLGSKELTPIYLQPKSR